MSEETIPSTTTQPTTGSAGAQKPGRLVRRTPRTARALDPQGIYDARSLARRQAAKRRRSASTVVLLALAGAAGTASIFKGREARVPLWQPTSAIEVDLDVAALASALLPPSALWAQAQPKQGKPRQAPTQAPTGAREVALVMSGRDGRMALASVRQASTAPITDPVWGAMWRASDFSLRAPALVAGDVAIVGGEDGVARAFDLSTRRLLWKSVGANPISSRAVLVGPTTAAPSTSRTSSTSASSLGLIVAVGDDSGVVRALRLRDGQVVWRASLGAPIGDGLSWARVRGGRALIFVPLLSGGARRGGVAAVDAASGRVAWRFPRDERVFAAMVAPPMPHALDGRMRLFCADAAGSVTALDAATGRSPQASISSTSATTSAKSNGEWKAFLAPLFPSNSSGPSWRSGISRGSSNQNTSLSSTSGASAATPLGSLEVEDASQREVSRVPLVSARLEPLWINAQRGPLILVAGNDGGVRAFEARSGRPAWAATSREAPVALLGAPPLDGVATIAVVTPHAVERRSAEDGRTLARFEWREEEGEARSAAATPTHLVVAGEDLILFAWASST